MWSKQALIRLSRSAKALTLLANVIFHFVVLGLVVRHLLFPQMPNEHWIMLIVLTFIMDPIIAYFFGWNMNLGGTVSADAPKFDRTISMVVLAILYICLLLIWLGVISDFSAWSKI